MSIKALSGKVFLLITGASRGIGRQIATSFGSVLQEGSHILLLATNLNALKESATYIPPSISVDTVSVDLGKATKDELHSIIMQSIKNKRQKEFDRVVIVHNAGTTGNVTESTNDMTDINAWRNYFDINVFSPAILNGVVMKIFNEETNTEKKIINITSLFGIQAGKGVGYYCTGKAAREMFFKVFALENPQVDVLNYSPGPVQTDMFQHICDEVGNQETKIQFNDMVKKASVLTCEQTVNRLLSVLKNRKYKSGDHVDYFDEI
ncbi:sepiapterin reductase-like isoform X1 [Hylaeus volcanicus]|uniref:sepiapterin reductase-like isoform X1 n=1 Tax=Hylaeus volcanicus TaxID=313075 RepID=UPI0023B7B7B3|nr:sepiapterin reductase-like isoform X1 [Hylaeus volcanicus]